MWESFQKNKKGILLMVISSVCTCFGQLCWKLSIQKSVVFLLSGFCIYGIGALLMIIAYRFGKLSVLQPILSLNYAISFVLAAFILREKVTFLNCVGVFAIMIGTLLIAGGDRE